MGSLAAAPTSAFIVRELPLWALSTHSLDVETAAQLDLLLGGGNRHIADGVSGLSLRPLGNALGDKKSGVLGG